MTIPARAEFKEPYSQVTYFSLQRRSWKGKLRDIGFGQNTNSAGPVVCRPDPGHRCAFLGILK